MVYDREEALFHAVLLGPALGTTRRNDPSSFSSEDLCAWGAVLPEGQIALALLFLPNLAGLCRENTLGVANGRHFLRVGAQRWHDLPWQH